MVDSLKPLLPLCYLFSRGLNQRMSGQCDAGVELLRARLGGYKRQLYLRHSLEADKSQSLPHEERTLVGLIFPPSWSQRDRRTEKAVLGCVCVCWNLHKQCLAALRGRSVCWAWAGWFKHPKRNCLSWKGLLRNHPGRVQSSLKNALWVLIEGNKMSWICPL